MYVNQHDKKTLRLKINVNGFLKIQESASRDSFLKILHLLSQWIDWRQQSSFLHHARTSRCGLQNQPISSWIFRISLCLLLENNFSRTFSKSGKIWRKNNFGVGKLLMSPSTLYSVHCSSRLNPYTITKIANTKVILKNVFIFFWSEVWSHLNERRGKTVSFTK